MTSQHKTNKFQASWHGICHEYANILHNLPKVISHHFLSRVVLSLGHAGLDSKASLPEIYLSIHVENTCCSVATLCPTLCNPMDCQVPLSMQFPRQDYRSGLLFPFPGDLPNPGIESWSPSAEPSGKPKLHTQLHIQ